MKHLSIYEGYVKNLATLTDITKFRKYVVFTEFDDYYLDNIIEFESTSDTIKTKTIAFYNHLTESTHFEPNDVEEIHFSAYSDGIIFSSEDYEQAKKHFDKLIEIHKDSKKYNL